MVTCHQDNGTLPCRPAGGGPAGTCRGRGLEGTSYSRELAGRPGSPDHHLAFPGKPGAAPRCLNTSAEVISSAPSDANNDLAGSILPLADFGAANVVGAKITNQTGQAGGFISRAWPIFWQVNQERLSSGHSLATPGPLYGGQAFANTWQHASSPHAPRQVSRSFA